jgi:catechol 2,3-dioxygenase-like lactoylglutathione lyase family enzyme
MAIGRLDHYSVRTGDVRTSEKFYAEVLGFVSGPRPPFDFPGAWLYSGDPDKGGIPVVHIIGVDSGGAENLKSYLDDRADKASTDTGALDHIAFRAEGLKELRDRCVKLGVPFRERSVPRSKIHQVFLKDPDGVTIELNYPGSEA